MADADAIARVHIESSADAYAPLAEVWPAPDLEDRRTKWEGRLAESQTHPTRCELVAEIDDRVVGFIGGGPARRDDVEAAVEVYVIHVLPAYRGEGAGGALWTAACEQIRGPSLKSMYVETLAELGCCSFYEARGGELVSSTPDTMHGGAVTKVVYRWAPGHSSEA